MLTSKSVSEIVQAHSIRGSSVDPQISQSSNLSPRIRSPLDLIPVITPPVSPTPGKSILSNPSSIVDANDLNRWSSEESLNVVATE